MAGTLTLKGQYPSILFSFLRKPVRKIRVRGSKHEMKGVGMPVMKGRQVDKDGQDERREWEDSGSRGGGQGSGWGSMRTNFCPTGRD